MSGAKDLIIRPISGRDAEAVVRKYHYSGKIVRNSSTHFGAFINGQLEGALSFGPPTDKRRTIRLVDGTGWANMLELNRMAFSPRLPRNSESRAISVACRILRKHAPQIKWILSFADGALCGDGTIYRASGFILTGIKPTQVMYRLPDGSTLHKLTLESSPTTPRPEAGGRSYYEVTGGKYNIKKYMQEVGGVLLGGYQLRYVRFLDPTWRDRLTVPELPYSAIADAGARMYLGKPLQ